MKISDNTRQALANEWLLEALLEKAPEAVINFLIKKSGRKPTSSGSPAVMPAVLLTEDEKAPTIHDKNLQVVAGSTQHKPGERFPPGWIKNAIGSLYKGEAVEFRIPNGIKPERLKKSIQDKIDQITVALPSHVFRAFMVTLSDDRKSWIVKRTD